ncbi:MAG: NUDIX domain-containing protein [Pseudomonadales bacterium]
MEINAHITVASIVPRDDCFLMVCEQQGQELVLNQPAGHWELGETLIQAARRETLEETCWQTEVTDFLGFGFYTAPHDGVTYCRANFLALPQSLHAELERDGDIVDVHWFSYAEIVAQRDKLRSPLVLQGIENYRAGVRYPLDIIYHHK